jgi:hypothetical protein
MQVAEWYDSEQNRHLPAPQCEYFNFRASNFGFETSPNYSTKDRKALM